MKCKTCNDELSEISEEYGYHAECVSREIRRLREALTLIEAVSDPGTGVQNEEAWATIHRLAEAALTVPRAKQG